MTPPKSARAFDVLLALQRTVVVFWHDFAPIIVLGFVMLTLPSVAQSLAGSHSGSTVAATFGGMLRVLYVVIVTVGSLARLTGKPLSPPMFVRSGIAASPRALSVAALLGAGVVTVLVLLLLAGLAGNDAAAVRVGVVVLALALVPVVIPAVPVALTARITPVTALVRSARLTRGNRGRIAVVAAIVALTIIPARFVFAATIYGLAATSAQVAAVDATMTLLSPGLWLMELFDLLAWGIAAVVPAVVYVGLTE